MIGCNNWLVSIACSTITSSYRNCLDKLPNLKFCTCICFTVFYLISQAIDVVIPSEDSNLRPNTYLITVESSYSIYKTARFPRPVLIPPFWAYFWSSIEIGPHKISQQGGFSDHSHNNFLIKFEMFFPNGK